MSQTPATAALLAATLLACSTAKPGTNADAGAVDASTTDGAANIDAAAAIDGPAGTDAAAAVDGAADPDGPTTSIDAGAQTPGTLAYEKIPNITVIDDLRRVRWHPSGEFALLLGTGGKVVRYNASDGSLLLVTTLGTDVVDIDVAADGSFFLVVGVESDAVGRLWRIAVDGSLQLSATEETTLSLGEPRAIERDPAGSTWAIGSSASSTTSYVYLWQDGSGIVDTNGYNASAGMRDLMWGDPAIYSGSDSVILGHGVNGADSKTYVLASDMVVANTWPGSFGNPGGAGWRPGGGYGFFTAWTTNKLYVFDGAWVTFTLPDVGTAASPNAVGWDATGTRALIVGRAIGPGLSGTVIDYRPGLAAAADAAFLVKASIPSFNLTPWFANTNTHLLGIDWRPATNCQEGLIVATDNGTSLNPTFGLAIRFYDSQDPDCAPLF